MTRLSNGWSRRDFLAGLTLTGTAALAGLRPSPLMAAEPPPETTTLRWRQMRSACWVPQIVAEDLLRQEGFEDIKYIKYENPLKADKEDINVGKIDMTIDFTGRMVRDSVPGNPSVFIAGLHVGCYSLMGSDKIGSVRDLKGKKVWAWTNLNAGPVVFFKTVVAYVGLDPEKDIEYVVVPMHEAVEMFKRGELDAFMSFPPGPQELKAQGIGKVLVDTNVDRPWSQYFCCSILANRDFVRRNPVATRRALRAVLKANDIVAQNPDMAARLVIDMKLKKPKDEKYLAQAFREIPYAKWRHYNPEDTIRFYALRLKELGMTEHNPQDIIAQNTDWSFIKSLKDELKMTW